MLLPQFSRGFARGAALTLLCGGAALAQSPPPAPAPAPVDASVDASAPASSTSSPAARVFPQSPAPGPPGQAAGAPRIQQGVPGGARRPSPPAAPWKPLFYDNNFSDYVGKPPYVFGEEFKLIALSEEPAAALSAGGQIRHRAHVEDNRLRPQGANYTDYQLWRNRNYLNLDTAFARVYVESIDAYNADSEIPPVAIDENRWDLLNAFVDFKLYDVAGGAGTFRYGRQEILYGDQHLLSPLDWANTRRNFEGYKFVHQADGWQLDLFSLTPVNLAAGSRGGDVNNFDEDDDDKRLWGAWLNRDLSETASADLFYLYQERPSELGTLGNAPAPSPRSADGERHLVGSRLVGTIPVTAGGGCDGVGGKVARTWDYDVQGGYQFGTDDGERVSAGFFNLNAGHTWNGLAWKPRVGALFYYGSGDDDPTDDRNNTFYTYYPLAHAYWGIIDNLNGQNLLDYALLASVSPTKKLSITGGYHLFRKASGNDFLYNVAQVGLGPQGAGTDIGNELDIVANYNVDANLSFQAGYAHFWYGDFAEENLDQAQDDGEFIYFQTTFNY